MPWRGRTTNASVSKDRRGNSEIRRVDAEDILTRVTAGSPGSVFVIANDESHY